MAATMMVHVRVDEHIKAQATETLAAMAEADEIAAHASRALWQC